MFRRLFSTPATLVRTPFDLQCDAWSVPFLVNKERVVALFHLSQPDVSSAVLAPKQIVLSPGVIVRDKGHMKAVGLSGSKRIVGNEDLRDGVNEDSGKVAAPLFAGALNETQRSEGVDVLFLPLLTTEPGDVHVFFGNSGLEFHWLAFANVTGGKRIGYPFVPRKGEHPVTAAIAVHHGHGKLKDEKLFGSSYQIAIALVDKIQKHLEETKDNVVAYSETPKLAEDAKKRKSKDKEVVRVKSADDGKTIYIHSPDSILANHFIFCTEQNDSVKEAEKWKSSDLRNEMSLLVQRVEQIKSAHDIVIKIVPGYDADTYARAKRVPPPFGMRTLYHEWLITAQKLADKIRRYPALFAAKI